MGPGQRHALASRERQGSKGQARSSPWGLGELGGLPERDETADVSQWFGAGGAGMLQVWRVGSGRRDSPLTDGCRESGSLHASN